MELRLCPATNISHLEPNAISEGITHPERFLGLHFFSSAHVMKLLEISAGWGDRA